MYIHQLTNPLRTVIPRVDQVDFEKWNDSQSFSRSASFLSFEIYTPTPIHACTYMHMRAYMLHTNKNTYIYEAYESLVEYLRASFQKHKR